MKKRALRICTALFMGILIIPISLATLPVRAFAANKPASPNSFPAGSISQRHSPLAGLKLLQAVNTFIFLPVIYNKWTAPCGTVPFLVSPPDGTHVTMSSSLGYDGGYRNGPIGDWIELEFSQNSNFGNSHSIFSQPADQYWATRIDFVGELPLGKYYWRVSLWCNGPSRFSVPPNGYDHSPFSEVRTFILEN